MTTFEVLYLISQYLIFLTGVIYAIVAYFQLRAIRRQTDITDKALNSTLRPKLIVRNVKIVSDLTEDTNLINLPVEIYLEVVNRGGIPAKVIAGNVTLILDHPRNPQFTQKITAYDGNDDTLKGKTLNAGYEQPCRVTKPEFNDDLQTILEFTQGLLTVYALGYFSYEDGRGNYYKTAFCRCYDRSNFRFTTVDHPDYEHAD